MFSRNVRARRAQILRKNNKSENNLEFISKNPEQLDASFINT